MRRLSVFIIVIIFSCHILPAYGYVYAPAYLCEMGIRYYNQGNYELAFHEFNKALLAQPGYPLALEYIDKIRSKTELIEEEKYIPAVKAAPKAPSRAARERGEERGIIAPLVGPVIMEGEILTKETLPPQTILLDENINSLIMPLEIEQAKNLIILGNNIRRFLVTAPEALTVEKVSPGELLLTGGEFGHTYLHLWDDRDRWTLEFMTVPAKIEGQTLEEQLRLAEERAGTFKLRYNLDWTSYERGRRIRRLDRDSYSYSHWISLDGQIPYGNFRSDVSVRSLRTTTDLTSLQLALTQGNLGNFKDFTLRAFDYTPGFTNLTFSSASLRGVMLESPAFNKKIDYTVFWGREGGGRYGNLSPGLSEIKSSFLSGLNLSYSPFTHHNYRFSVIRGWGRDRPGDLNPYNYDLSADWNLKNWGLRYEIAHDSDTFAHLFNTNFNLPKLRLGAEVRNTDKDFKTSTSWGWRVGELGALFTLFSKPTEKLNISGRLDVFQDRLYPSLEDEDRWNQDLNWDANYEIDPLTSLRLDYALQNELGRVGQYRYQNMGIGLNRRLELIRKISTFVNYRHQENKNFSSPSLDYVNEKIFAGLRFSLIGELYYYFNKEFNWLEERSTGGFSQPGAIETGIDWSGQILSSPFHGNFRCVYRDEEDAASSLSFLSGEDYLEGYAELSYRPDPNKELYCSARIRNIWADNPDVSKRVEADFHAGMRYLWDTGIRWEPIGTIDGYVFNDFNSDGLRQRNEPPVDGIKVWLGKEKSQITDILGYYKFSKAKAKKIYLTIDTTTIPSGFILTVPATQEAAVIHGQTARVNFGIASRSEIAGIVFNDLDGDNQLGPNDIPVRGVVLILEDGTKVTTGDSGRYFFRNAPVGKHTLTLDLNSIPPEYLPSVPLFKDIELFEGMSYNYNIPLKTIRQQ